jgi:hypothetical protein
MGVLVASRASGACHWGSVGALIGGATSHVLWAAAGQQMRVTSDAAVPDQGSRTSPNLMVQESGCMPAHAVVHSLL